MKLFKMFKRGQKGFTLVELMVVMAIMAVLATIVVPAVTGTKGPAESTQLSGDANAIQSAAAKFNNDSANATAPWPVGAEANTKYATGYACYLSDGTTAVTMTFGTAAGQYTAIDWNAPTSIRLKDGSLKVVTFVPDFVPKPPASETAMTGADGTGKHVYLWVLKAGAATDAATRTVEVYKTNDGGTIYTKVY